jgi:hypothetical protein
MYTQRRTALTAAASGKSIEIVAALLTAKANPNLCDSKVSLGIPGRFSVQGDGMEELGAGPGFPALYGNIEWARGKCDVIDRGWSQRKC